MANEEQLSILKQGVEVWNKWVSKFRSDNSVSPVQIGTDYFKVNDDNDKSRVAVNKDAKQKKRHSENTKSKDRLSFSFTGEPRIPNIDLSGAFLSYTDLNGVDFGEANLIKTNLNEADLRRAKLRIANLREARLIKTKLNFADMRGANLREANLLGANLQGADLRSADLSGADLLGADLSDANLMGAKLERANLIGAKLVAADLRSTKLSGADMSEADLRKANLSNSNLSRASLVGTSIDGATISGSSVYAINVWDLKGDFAEQVDLIITPDIVPIITVDNIKVAQFIYLILNNEELRSVIDTLTSKSILILGRFSPAERKATLDTLKDKLREYKLLPIVFDFDRPTDRDFTETIKTLAGLSYFVIADVTNPKSSPLELQAMVPDYQIPFVPIIQEGESPFAMMVDLQKKYKWVLNTVSYDSQETLMKVLKPLIIDPAMQKRQELRLIKAQEPEVISGKEYLAKGKK